ncbi:MAG: hypothetical protein JWM64_2668 [Frankiales bacterium]|nr:hypothetical protein [Frankiales bacterium]
MSAELGVSRKLRGAQIAGTDVRTRVLVLGILASFLIPDVVQVRGLKSLGTPTQFMGCVALYFLVSGRGSTVAVTDSRATPTTRATRFVSIALSIFVTWAACSWASARLRPLTPVEASSSTRILLLLLGDVAVAYFVVEIARRRHETLPGRQALLAGAYFSGFVALLQFYTSLNIADTIGSLPIFSADFSAAALQYRTVVRTVGTAGHPIAYATLCGAVLPLALNAFTHSTAPRRKAVHAVGCVLLAFGALTGISRAAVIGLVVALVVYGVGLRALEVRRLLMRLLVFLALVQVLARGVLSTLRYFFTHTSAASDASVAGRTDDYAATDLLVSQHPLVGLGLGTYQKDQYRILDNQYLQTLVEGGYVGLACLLLLALVTTCAGIWAIVREPDEAARAQNGAVVGGIAALWVDAVFFDMFSFRQSAFVLFLYVGWLISITNGFGRDKHQEKDAAPGRQLQKRHSR